MIDGKTGGSEEVKIKLSKSHHLKDGQTINTAYRFP
jgi:hypothetical protein